MPADDLLLRFIVERDARCPVCGYSLTGLRDDVCPECGSQMELVLGATDPRLGVWLVGLVLAAFPTGFSGIVLVWGLTMGAPREDLIPVGVCVVFGGSILTLLIRGRRRFRRLRRRRRIGLVLASSRLLWGLVGVFLAVVN